VITKLKINSLVDNATSLKDGASFCFCAYVLRISGWSERQGFPKDGTYYYRGILARFMTGREGHVLARAVGIQKENKG